MGGTILTGTPVRRIESRSDGGIDFATDSGRMSFDGAIATSPSPVFAALAPELSREYLRKLKTVKYLGMVCVVLLLKRQLTPFYVTNLTADDVPFTGIIE